MLECLRRTGEARPSQDLADGNRQDSAAPALAHDVPVTVMRRGVRSPTAKDVRVK